MALEKKRVSVRMSFLVFLMPKTVLAGILPGSVGID